MSKNGGNTAHLKMKGILNTAGNEIYCVIRRRVLVPRPYYLEKFENEGLTLKTHKMFSAIQSIGKFCI